MSTDNYYDVVVRRAIDGAERTYRIQAIWQDDQFFWEDGNGACDCNRGSFFAHAGGEADAQESCGDSRYLVVRFILPDGRTVDGPDATHRDGAGEVIASA